MRMYRYLGRLLFLFVLLINGCAGISIEEDKYLVKYPSTSISPVMDGVCSEVKLPDVKQLNEIRLGFYPMGAMRVKDSGSGKVADMCSELSRKAQNAGAHIVFVDKLRTNIREGATGKWERGKYIPFAGPMVTTYGGYIWDSYLYVYDPDRVKKTALENIEYRITQIEQQENILWHMYKPETFPNRKEFIMRWRKDFANFSDVRAFVKQGSYSEAIDRIKRTKKYVEDSKLQSNLTSYLDMIKGSLEDLIKLPSLTKDPEIALRQYREKRAASGKVSP